MKRVFQLVSSEDGVRSPPFVSSREDLAAILQKDVEGVTQADLVLVLGDLDDQEQFTFVFAPLMRVDTFISHFGVQQ